MYPGLPQTILHLCMYVRTGTTEREWVQSRIRSRIQSILFVHITFQGWLVYVCILHSSTSNNAAHARTHSPALIIIIHCPTSFPRRAATTPTCFPKLELRACCHARILHARWKDAVPESKRCYNALDTARVGARWRKILSPLSDPHVKVSRLNRTETTGYRLLSRSSQPAPRLPRLRGCCV